MRLKRLLYLNLSLLRAFSHYSPCLSFFITWKGCSFKTRLQDLCNKEAGRGRRGCQSALQCKNFSFIKGLKREVWGGSMLFKHIKYHQSWSTCGANNTFFKCSPSLFTLFMIYCISGVFWWSVDVDWFLWQAHGRYLIMKNIHTVTKYKGNLSTLFGLRAREYWRQWRAIVFHRGNCYTKDIKPVMEW